MNGISLKLAILLLCNESPLSPAELVSDRIVDPKNCNSLLYKLTMQQLASEWTSSN